ncbi:restriction endonuclease subunit R [Moraxella caviae]|uniref:Type I restriction enzyme endonuclease subunit n=1 Tax=Moraxella caviae TaxID=34060 RepID=A0A1T0AAW9_9GAMM|nr:type I restriction endonuclease subunit R [Moraxella caviae]OOR92830.1 restriction endonuclease subunit R [Moraxella caviae]STZ14128.1 Type-1 restriction enzyme R protein [Moraxella caviae]
MYHEADLENTAIATLVELGWRHVDGGALPDGFRENDRQVIFDESLFSALSQLNPDLPTSAITDAMTVLKRDSTNLYERNQTAYTHLKSGVSVSYRDADGNAKQAMVSVVDFYDVANNDFIIVSQLSIQGQRQRRPDLIAYINGLPVAVFELKNPADENATLTHAYRQIDSAKRDVSQLFVYHQLSVISDGIQARIGSLTADLSRFAPWFVVDESTHSRVAFIDELDALLHGLFTPSSLLSYIANFVLFEDGVKKIANYHQYYGVKAAIENTEHAFMTDSGKIGVMWHTQGSGKSISMLFYTAMLTSCAQLNNPTIVVITDRTDLDGQLFATFSRGKQLLGQTPIQAESIDSLRDELGKRGAGGVIFSTIQKFAIGEGELRHPVLNERKNIVVITDEAHRTQYGFMQTLGDDGKYKFGFAKHLRDALPNASFIGFTGTPISEDDRDTKEVFGEYISIYDLEDAVKDGATVPIIYEARQAKLGESGSFDDDVAQIEAILADETHPEHTKKLGVMNLLKGNPKRLNALAHDILAHYDKRTEQMDGKAMVVMASRKMCVDLYDCIGKIRPEWLSDDVGRGRVKIMMTASSTDPENFAKHSYNKIQKETIEKRFKDPSDELVMVIVCDMWLTGFDVPCCNTMYIDKPMAGHNLMQAIARVNRVFKNKDKDNGGLIVDYTGLFDELKKAYAQYTKSGKQELKPKDTSDVIAKLKDELSVIRGQFAEQVDGKAFDVNLALQIDEPQALFAALRQAANHIVALDRQKPNTAQSINGKAPKSKTPRKDRFLQAVRLAKKGYALCGMVDEVAVFARELAFFDRVRAIIVKNQTGAGGVSIDEVLLRVKLLAHQAVDSDGVVDLFEQMQKSHPNIALLSPEFLALVKSSDTPDLWALAMQKYLSQEIAEKSAGNLTLKTQFAQKLKEAMTKYHNNQITVLEVIEAMIELSKTMQEQLARGEHLGLNFDELAFYDALAQNDSAKELMGDELLKQIATIICQKVKSSATVDWRQKQNVQARLRVEIKRILRRFKYPPDYQESAVERVIEQAQGLANDVAGE